MLAGYRARLTAGAAHAPVRPQEGHRWRGLLGRRGRWLLGALLFALGVSATTSLGVAQPASGKLPRVSFLSLYPAPTRSKEVRAELEKLGWVDGKTMVWDLRTAEGRPDRLNELAAQFAASSDVVVAMLAIDAIELQRVTRTVPIVIWASHGAVET